MPEVHLPLNPDAPTAYRILTLSEKGLVLASASLEPVMTTKRSHASWRWFEEQPLNSGMASASWHISDQSRCRPRTAKGRSLRCACFSCSPTSALPVQPRRGISRSMPFKAWEDMARASCVERQAESLR